MELIEFIAKYPKLLNHPNLHLNLNFAAFRHELCHFLEREMEKAFLINFGFKESFGQELTNYSHNYFCNFVKREIRVICLEQVFPLISEDKTCVNFSDTTIFQIRTSNLSNYFEQYKIEQEKYYTREVWCNLFKEKYEAIDRMCYNQKIGRIL